jgi:hypothetical protein
VFWAFSSKASTAAYFAANGTQISKAEYEAQSLKKSADILELKYILNGDSPKNPDTAKYQLAESDANESNEDEDDEDAEDEEDFEEDEEYDDEVVQINDPFFGINYAFFQFNDILYVVVSTATFFITCVFRSALLIHCCNLREPKQCMNWADFC